MEFLPFLEDIYPPDLLYAITIRSPVAKGYLKFIQVPLLSDDYTLITAKNIPGENRLEGANIPILADGQLSYIGEPVAVLLGKNKTKLKELAAKCVVCVDEETAVFNINDPQSHTVVERIIETGSIDEAFEKTGRLVTGSFSTGIQDHWYAEPIGAVTWYTDEQKDDEPQLNTNKKNVKAKKTDTSIIIRTATQWPHHVKRACLLVLGTEQSSKIKLDVEATALNLHMDGKLWYPSLVACHAVIGTFVTKKPVRLILTREEDFLFTPKRAACNIDIATSINENGNILASKIDISVNLGAYGVNTDEILDNICLGVLGFYKIDNLRLTAKAKLSNIPPQGPFSGFGLSQGLFAIERHVSQIADMINIDPAEWRLNRLDLTPARITGKAINQYEELFSSAAKMSDYYRKWASHDLLRQSRKGKKHKKVENPRGIGIAAGYQNSGFLYHGEDKGVYNVEVTLTKESILEIKASITTSEDYTKIWEKVVMETMSIKPEMIRFIPVNTLDSGPSSCSRNITAVTKLVEKCCLAIRKQRFHDPLPITVRRSIKPQSGTLLGGLISPPSGKTMDISGFQKPALCAAVVEVSIDLVECIPVIRGIWLSVDGGKIISKNRARRSLTRGAIAALGWAFTENIMYVNGMLPKAQYDNFTIFSPVEIPPIHIDFLESDTSEPKGIGDLPFACIPAAFLQAVSQAMGYCFKSLPLKRKDIWEMIQIRTTEYK
jgi:CO/xanthine dehydrogenase Mo-binding subunit